MVLLAQLSISDFAARLASNEPAPGGGSAAALAGLLGASLMEMVINLTVGRREFVEYTQLLTEKQTQLASLHKELEQLIHLDAAAFKGVMDAYRLPQGSDVQKQKRQETIQAAVSQAAEVPLAIAQAALEVMVIAQGLLGKTNPHAVSDLTVGALASHTGVVGALLNTAINLPQLEDDNKVNAFKGQVRVLRRSADELLAAIEEHVYGTATFTFMRRGGPN